MAIAGDENNDQIIYDSKKKIVYGDGNGHSNSHSDSHSNGHSNGDNEQ